MTDISLAAPQAERVETLSARAPSTALIDPAVALLLYLPTLFFVPHPVYLLSMLAIVVRSGRIELQKRDMILLAFIAGAFINILAHAGDFSWSQNGSSIGVPTVLLTVIAARSLDRRVLRWLPLFTCLEVGVGVYQFASGQVALFPSQIAATGQELTSSSQLLYDLRVFGLTDNSSVFAEKIFLSILLVLYLPGSARAKALQLAILAVGMYVTFNRTTIVTIALLFLTLGFVWSLRRPVRLIVFASAVTVVVSLLLSNFDAIILEFTRGSGSAGYSEQSRLFFVLRAFETVVENPVSGNGSLTFRVFDPLTNTFQHSHNSISMLLATHGLILSALMLLFLGLGYRKDTLPYVFAMLVYSMTQYLFFWNISIADLLFHYFLRGKTRAGRS